MDSYYGLQGKKYTASTLLAKGGEGEIFTVLEDALIVIKIYISKDKDPKINDLSNAERLKKLVYMIQNPPKGNLNDQIAWPLDVLKNVNGQFVGFVMRKIAKIKSIKILYEASIGTKTKSLELPWTKKIKVAKNLCSVVHAVHKVGHTIGDFNPNNIGINPQSLKVVLMDTDSYHIVTNTQTFRCGVGNSEYVPAEIQLKMKGGNDLKNASLPTFTFQTDYFALAIHIFKLLMGGHPYTLSAAPSKRSVVRPNLEDNILRGQTAYFDLPDGLTYPSFTPPVVILPKPIQDLFIRAFIKGTKQPSLRPNEEEWYNALVLLEQDLTQCSSNPLHQYPSHNTACPWCKVQLNIKQTTKANIMVAPKTRSKTYTSSGFTTGEYILILTVMLIGLILAIAIIFGIVGIFTGGFGNFFPSFGSVFVFLFNIGVFVWDSLVWIFKGLFFILEIIWIVFLWLWDGLWFLLGVLWDVLIWLFDFLFNQVFPLIWVVIVWLWDGLIWLINVTFTQVLPFIWNGVVWIWNLLWLIVGTAWEITVIVITWLGNQISSIFNFFIGFFS
jgi:serine/threonine protein kinase